MNDDYFKGSDFEGDSGGDTVLVRSEGSLDGKRDSKDYAATKAGWES